MKSIPYPLATRLAVLVLLPVIGGAAWLHHSLRASLPPEGTFQLTREVSAPVSITRDENGVPHIRATTDIDAFHAVGYAHAQDRLWQLELQRRLASGRLSEVFGKKSIDTDVWFRTLGLYESARSAWPALSPQAQRSLTAYAAGINAWIAEGHSLPAEFRVLGIKPEPWTELDSLAWVKVFALDLGGNFRREIDRYVARQALSEPQLTAFFPNYPADAPATVAAISGRPSAPLEALAQLQQQLETEHAIGGTNVGSNAWVVSGRHTRDGAALLSNDPHLGLQIPSLWYAMNVDAPAFKVSGMSLVGLPVVVLGRNAHIAWGGTNMMADVQDLFFERTDASGERYLAQGQWLPFSTRVETIDVRADFPEQLRRRYAPVTLKVRSTRNGPVISDYHGVFRQPVTLRWTALEAGDTSYEAFFRLNQARDWEGFKAALARHVAPAMNLLFIDRAGNIGYLGAGRIPVRRQGEGTLPSPGWDDAWGWSGQVSPSQWPQSYNPPSGFIVNANNPVANHDDPYFISHDWAPTSRARRIEYLLRQRIASGKGLTAQDMQHIQADTVDMDAAAMMSVLRKRLPRGEHASQAAEYLKDWNGDMRADSQAAAIFSVWMRHFRQRVFGAALQGSWEQQPANRILRGLQEDVPLDYLRTLAGESSARNGGSTWCDDAGTPAPETCEEALADSQKSALWELYKLKGDWSMASWRWDGVQRTAYDHTPFSDFKPLDRIFQRRIGNGGSAGSINVAASDFKGADGYLQKFGPGFRQIIALRGARTSHYYMNSTGQSGNFMSPHYDDMVVPFRDARFLTLDDAPAASGKPAAH
ncbi:penicillin acylase family protein [Agrilutibacter solisilvae]|uniref:Penicillin acylase family protein n=1 Tax=Agrilutibacter solisilvae TaxID=2763317 RepID=A0A975ATS3_9GAMM|nr:penicillin acylase family protein [Lysobacter solisilvae]QSX79613.1 penicillin acylase family protein [Lysobacter solisilvae]